MELDLKEVIEKTGAKVLKNATNIDKFSFSTDTRTVKSGELFIPIKGESFDGENFIEQALENGANGYLTRGDKIFASAEVVLKVEDTLVAYLELANLCRQKINPKVIAITGSSGKTTTKEMMSAIFSESFKTHKTAKNHNNEIGFCQTMFEMPLDTEVLIVEMGMRGLGEIEILYKYSQPDVSIITNVGTAHIGRLGSRENIAKAKCEIVKYQNPNGVFIAENDDLTAQTVDFCGDKIFVKFEDVEFLTKEIGYTKFSYKGNIFKLNVSGDYNVKNAILCIEAAFALGMNVENIQNGLKNYKNIEKRFEIQEECGFKIVNDSYNANPESVKAFLKTVFELYKNSVIVLGNMGELGENEKFYHQEVGKFIVENVGGNVKILTVGKLANEITNVLPNTIFSKNFESTEKVANYILDNIDNSNTIFLKASRSEKFEEIIKHLKGDNL